MGFILLYRLECITLCDVIGKIPSYRVGIVKLEQSVLSYDAI
jgi:hypothetical protein